MAGPVKLSEYRTKYWKLLIYAVPGAGKSVFAGSSQELRTFVFDTDEGMSSVRAWIVKKKLKNDLVTFWPCKTKKDFLDAFRWLEQHWREYDLVVVDTITQLQKTLKLESFATPHKDPRQNWGEVGDAMDLIIAQFKGKPWHVIILAHEMRKDDVFVGTEVARPAFQGGFKDEYARYFSVIGRYSMWWANVKVKDANGAEKVERRLQRYLECGPNPAIHSKDRSGVLARFEKPDVDYILKKLISSQGTDEELMAIVADQPEQPDDPGEVALNNAVQQAQKEEE